MTTNTTNTTARAARISPAQANRNARAAALRFALDNPRDGRAQFFLKATRDSGEFRGAARLSAVNCNGDRFTDVTGGYGYDKSSCAAADALSAIFPEFAAAVNAKRGTDVREVSGAFNAAAEAAGAAVRVSVQDIPCTGRFGIWYGVTLAA